MLVLYRVLLLDIKACDSESRLSCGSEMQVNNGRQWNRLLRFDSWKRQPHPHIISHGDLFSTYFCFYIQTVWFPLLFTTIIIIHAPCQESKAEKYLFLLKMPKYTQIIHQFWWCILISLCLEPCCCCCCSLSKVIYYSNLLSVFTFSLTSGICCIFFIFLASKTPSFLVLFLSH